jgi:hypothetical protein
MLGICNKTYSCLLEKIAEAKLWPLRLHLHQESYHSSVFEGNECRKLLKNVDLLKEILSEHGKLQDGIVFVMIFVHFRNVIDIVFDSSKCINLDSLSSEISSFQKNWKLSKMSVTTKVHLVVHHLANFVESKVINVKEMSHLCEQSHEAIHAEFLKTWNNYAIKEISNPHYASKLLSAVLDYNGSHAK